MRPTLFRRWWWFESPSLRPSRLGLGSSLPWQASRQQAGLGIKAMLRISSKQAHSVFSDVDRREETTTQGSWAMNAK
jgi:hypothetical protein